MITFRQTGNFKKINSFLERAKEGVDLGILDKYGRLGVEALSLATPVDTGVTAGSWYYTIERDAKGKIALNFGNRNIENGCPVAIVIQYGHATLNGGWVEGLDYINPAIKPIFDKIAKETWKGVVK